MPKGMLGNSETLRAFISGPVTDLLVKANGEDADTWQREFAKFLRKEPTWQNGPAVQSRERPKLLESIATVPVPATKRFLAADHFRLDTSRKAKVKVAFLGDIFKKNFVPKVETDLPAGELKIHKLLRDSVDAPITAELGAAHETCLADLWALLLRQPNGETKVGGLLVNGRANIFYIHDTQGVLWAVSARWNADDGRWCLYAHAVSDPIPWHADYRVVSR